jgi:hypothetical protein
VDIEKYTAGGSGSEHLEFSGETFNESEENCLQSIASGCGSGYLTSKKMHIALPLSKQNADVDGVFMLKMVLYDYNQYDESCLNGWEWLPDGCTPTATGSFSFSREANSGYKLSISSTIGTHTLTSTASEIMDTDPIRVTRIDQDGISKDFLIYEVAKWFLDGDPDITNNYTFGLGYWLSRIVGKFTPQGKNSISEWFTQERYYWNIPPYAFIVSNFLPTGDFVGSFDEVNTGDPPIPDLPTQVVFSGGGLLELTESTGEDQRFQNSSSVGIIF